MAPFLSSEVLIKILTSCHDYSDGLQAHQLFLARVATLDKQWGKAAQTLLCKEVWLPSLPKLQAFMQVKQAAPVKKLSVNCGWSNRGGGKISPVWIQELLRRMDGWGKPTLEELDIRSVPGLSVVLLQHVSLCATDIRIVIAELKVLGLTVAYCSDPSQVPPPGTIFDDYIMKPLPFSLKALEIHFDEERELYDITHDFLRALLPTVTGVQSLQLSDSLIGLDYEPIIQTQDLVDLLKAVSKTCIFLSLGTTDPPDDSIEHTQIMTVVKKMKQLKIFECSGVGTRFDSQYFHRLPYIPPSVEEYRFGTCSDGVMVVRFMEICRDIIASKKIMKGLKRIIEAECVLERAEDRGLYEVEQLAAKAQKKRNLEFL